MDAATIIFQIDSTLLGNVLVANLPQMALSTSYYYYNSLLTTMLMAAEYDGYAVTGTSERITSEKPRIAAKKGLRVSGNLQGAQRSTHFLSLPYRYSLPLLLGYAVLHWLVSQSIFYVKVTMYNAAQERVPSADVNACGWSPLALILSIAMGAIMVLVLLGLGVRRFRSCIPLAGSCSAAISAACHRPSNNSKASAERVIWGETAGSSSLMEEEELVNKDTVLKVRRVDSDYDQQGHFGHCSFTSCAVRQPSLDKLYI